MCETDMNIRQSSSFYFTPETILPTQSFTGRLLYAAAMSDLLNPPNYTVKTPMDKWIGKPLRFVGRMVYLLFINLIAGPLGTITHLSASACYGTLSLVGRVKKDQYAKGKFEAYAWEHLKSAGFDFLSSLGIMTPAFVDEPNTVVHAWMSGTKVKVMENNRDKVIRFDYYVHAKLQAREFAFPSFILENGIVLYG